VVFAFQNVPQSVLELSGVDATPMDLDSGIAKFDLTLWMIEDGKDLRGHIEYNTDLLDADTIERMTGHFTTLLAGIVADPDQRLSDLPLLPEARRRLVATGNRAPCVSRDPGCLHRWFESRVERAPDAVAAVCGDERLTYRELNARANQLAHRLQSLGVAPDRLVGLCVERSLRMIVGILGILKAGGAYLPLDPAYPKERLRFMLEDSEADVLVTDEPSKAMLPEHAGRVVCLDSDRGLLAELSVANPRPQATPANLAYVIYTSGSTGKPKGVLVTHRNVARLFTATEAWFHFDARDVWTLFHSHAFDFSVWEYWGALLYGGRLVVVPFDVSRSPAAFYELLRREGVTVLNQTPSAFRQLAQTEANAVDGDGHWALRLIIFGGESLDVQSLEPWFARHGDNRPQLVNMYGITETTVHVTYRPIATSDTREMQGSPIGVPIPDLRVYVLDGRLRPAPIGIPGELYVGGSGVARGYLKRPELTSERFLPDPFSRDPDARLYRSGDRARYLADGSLEYWGRLDQQVKIRGFRIELGEIEAVLRQHPEVREAVVIARDGGAAGTRLAAYIVPGEPATSAHTAWREFLKRRLPDYMIPATFTIIEAVPLTGNGKVDHRALPDPAHIRPAFDADFVAPETPVQRELAAIWSDVLGVDRVGLHDNFFDLGGHSLMVTQVVSRVRTAFEVQLPIREIFDKPTVAELAEIIEQSQIGQATPQDILQELKSLDTLSDEEIRALLADEGSES
jgi:amino acid adenylation domain-containing protein